MVTAAISAVDADAISLVVNDDAPALLAEVTSTGAERRQGAIFALAALANSGRELDATLAEIHRIVSVLLPAEHFLIALREPDSNGLRAAVATPAARAMVANPGPDHAEVAIALARGLVREPGSFRGSGTQLSRRFPELVPPGMENTRWLATTVHGEDQRAAGALVLLAREGGPDFAELDEALLAFVSGQVQVALLRRETAAEMQELVDRQRSERLQAALYSIGELGNGIAGGERFYAAIHDIIGDVLDCRNLSVAQLSPDASELQFPYYVNDREPIPPTRTLGRGLHEYVIRQRNPVCIDLGESESRAKLARLVAAGEIVDSRALPGAWLGVPLVCANRVVGVVSVQSYAPDPPYDERDQEFLAFLAYQIGNALERQQAAASLRAANASLEQRVSERTRQLQIQMEVREQIEQQLKHETLHDFLTGLPNRAFLCDRLMRSLALQTRDPGKNFAVLFMDLDRFKVINDSAGHLVGDELLKEVGRRLQDCVRSPDMVARLGGDEFAVLIEDVGIVDTAVKIAQRIVEHMKEPICVEGKELFTSVSIGIAISAPEYRMAEEMLRDADIAMYRAKANEVQRFEIFNESLHLEAIRALETEGDLHRAISRREFEPYFQSIVRLDGGEVIGFESLLRWNHPERGVLTPDAFLAIAEASGSLEEIDWQMFDLSCAAVAKLLAPGQYVNLNFSPRHFRDKHMDTRLLALLREHAVAPGQVRIEVTEGTLIDNPDQVAGIIERLHAAGVLTSLDDFGTGYSSLSYLHRFHLHAVKIDKSFVSALQPGGGGPSEAVVRAILALSKSQGLDVIAEGVETLAQRDALLALGCRMGQGWLYSRPLPLHKLVSRR
ncbi:MAG: GGDEF domain-containing protein [Arenimonas sp.]